MKKSQLLNQLEFKNIAFTTLLCILFINLDAQEKPFVLFGGRAHIGNGKVIENSFISVENGKITAVADATVVRIDASRYNVINVAEKDIYPALIAPATLIGLTEIESVRATRDFAEVGEFNPNIRTVISYNTDSKVTPTIRSNGVLLAQVCPQGAYISGTSSVMKLDGWNWEDAAYKTDDGIWVDWPNLYNRSGWWAQPGETTINKEYEKEVQKIRTFLTEAKAYSQEKISKKNLKFEAMRGVFAKQKKVYIRAQYAKAFYDVIQLKNEFNIDLVIQGGAQIDLVIPELVKQQVPVIIPNTHSLPNGEDNAYDAPYTLAKKLQDAGVLFCFSIDGFWQVRNLPFIAGTAAAYGLSKEEALAGITSNTAKILGLENTGTLEMGKDAHLIISSGDVLDMKTSTIEKAFISGKEIDLNNKQKELYKKYADKYQLK